MTALDEQIGGSHYRNKVIQPWVFNKLNNLPATEAHIVEYICRWREKGGIQDLRKIQQYCDMLIEHEEIVESVKTSKVCQSCFDKHLVARTFGYEFMKCVCKCHVEISRVGDCEKCALKLHGHYVRDGEVIPACKCDCHEEAKDAG